MNTYEPTLLTEGVDESFIFGVYFVRDQEWRIATAYNKQRYIFNSYHHQL